ncbi:MAG: hypothetical protein KDH96_00825 [Candidatus Riesia sp.]|nr:hypothetical protein [Candidatus Riesia sp.]
MACSSCNKRMIIRAQPKQLIKVADFTYNNDDFIVVTYMGETGDVVGFATEIKYGHRVTNSTMLVHKDDYAHESNNNIFVKESENEISS